MSCQNVARPIFGTTSQPTHRFHAHILHNNNNIQAPSPVNPEERSTFRFAAVEVSSVDAGLDLGSLILEYLLQIKKKQVPDHDMRKIEISVGRIAIFPLKINFLQYSSICGNLKRENVCKVVVHIITSYPQKRRGHHLLWKHTILVQAT